MGWSPLSTEVHNTSQYSARTQSAKGVVLHHGATTSAQQIIDMEVSGSRQVSSHQVVKDKRNAGVVQEQFRAWSLSSGEWDSWAFTVECANESTNGWTISDASHETLAQLTADWATRYGFWPHRDGDPRTWTVYGHREIYSIFGASYATACPGGMNLEFVTKRAQQILAGTAPSQGDIMELTTVYFDQGEKKDGFASTGIITPVTGFVQTSDGYGPRDTLEAYKAIAGVLGWPIKESHVDANGWVLSQLFAVPGSSGGASASAIAAAVDASLKDDFATVNVNISAAQRDIIAKLSAAISGIDVTLTPAQIAHLVDALNIPTAIENAKAVRAEVIK